MATEVLALRVEKSTADSLRAFAADQGLSLADLLKSKIVMDHSEVIQLKAEIARMQERIDHMQEMQKPKYPYHKSVKMNLTTNQYYAIRLLAKKQGLSMSAFCRNLLNQTGLPALQDQGQ